MAEDTSNIGAWWTTEKKDTSMGECTRVSEGSFIVKILEKSKSYKIDKMSKGCPGRILTPLNVRAWTGLHPCNTKVSGGYHLLLMNFTVFTTHA